MLGRPILKKQTAYSFYRPAAIAIANTVADVPFSAARVLIYDIIIYFMSHLNRSAGGFFTYHLFVSAIFSAVTLSSTHLRFFSDVPHLLDDARFLQVFRSHVQ